MSIQGKNILFMVNGLRYGGMERQLVELIKSLVKSKYIVFLIVLNKRGPFSEVIQNILDQPIQYFDRRKLKIISTISKLIKFVKKNGIQIIHVQDNFSAFYALPVSKLLKIPLINGSIRHAGVSQGFSYYYEKMFLKLSTIIIANSKAGLNFFDVNGHVIYNFINLNRFNTSNGLLDKIVMNANFHHLKDHMTFITAVNSLRSIGRVKKVGLIGDGPKRKKYEELVKQLGMSDLVKFYGHVNNVEEILSEYGIGVLCSTRKYKEGLSNALLEYMGSGLIAIGSNIGGTPELIEDGINGFLFDAENTESLCQKIIHIQNNPKQKDQITENAINTLRKQHSPDLNINKYISIISNI